VQRGRPLELVFEPERQGYIFDGLYQDRELTQRHDMSTPIMDSMTLFVRWNTGNNPDTGNPPGTSSGNNISDSPPAPPNTVAGLIREHRVWFILGSVTVGAFGLVWALIRNPRRKRSRR
jgi:hypothetical protein